MSYLSSPCQPRIFVNRSGGVIVGSTQVHLVFRLPDRASYLLAFSAPPRINHRVVLNLRLRQEVFRVEGGRLFPVLGHLGDQLVVKLLIKRHVGNVVTKVVPLHLEVRRRTLLLLTVSFAEGVFLWRSIPILAHPDHEEYKDEDCDVEKTD